MMGHKNVLCPSHTEKVFDVDQFPHVVDWASRIIRNLNPGAIVVCGHSGLPIGGAVSYLTGIPLFAVRKEGEYTVAGSPNISAVVPQIPVAKPGAVTTIERWVWLDDTIQSGGTMARAAKYLWKSALATPVPAACVLYSHYAGTAEAPVIAVPEQRWMPWYLEIKKHPWWRTGLYSDSNYVKIPSFHYKSNIQLILNLNGA